MFQTGVAVEIPPGYFGLLRPRSSICKTGYLFASSGIIDSGYRGEIGVPLRWMGNGVDTYRVGDRIAQLVILPLPAVSFVQVDKLSESVRGEGGFGSSGR
jgi:dUTP pyrophosphatase